MNARWDEMASTSCRRGVVWHAEKSALMAGIAFLYQQLETRREVASTNSARVIPSTHFFEQDFSFTF